MARLQDLLEERAEVEREIAATQVKERSAALAHVTQLMEQYGITASDLGGRKLGRPAKARPAATATPPAQSRRATRGKRGNTLAGSKVPPKYRNKSTGETWSGRGLKPRWLAAAIASGKKLTDFAI